MFTVKRFFLLHFLLSSSLISAQTIKVAAIDWCPQICNDKLRPGYTVELIKEIYQGSEYQLQIDIFPWSRAIKYVSEGKYDALLAPAKKEAPQLVFPRFGVEMQRMCFFTSTNEDWLFKGELSLVNKQIGIAYDTSIEELNDYIKKHPEQFQFQPYHERYVSQNAKKVLKGRIDAFLFTKNTTILELKKAALEQSIKSAGCVSQAEIYLAFTANKNKSEKVTSAIRFFEYRLELLVKSGYKDKLYQKYGID